MVLSTKFGQNSQDIEHRRNYDGLNDGGIDEMTDRQNDGQCESSIAPLFSKQGNYNSCWLVGFVALRPKSTAMVIAGRSVHLTTLFPGQA